MSFLLSVLLLTIAGYALALLCRVCRHHLVADIALGWFLGSGFYALSGFLVVYLLHGRLTALTSLGIVAVPVAIVLARFKHYVPRLRASRAALPPFRYFPRKRVLLYALLSALALVVFFLAVLHGKNTPTHTDDAVRVRAYTPILVYENNFTDQATRLILSNGIFPSFVPVLSWQLQGSVTHFHVNYLVLTNLFFFLVLIYVLPTLRDRPEHGVWNVFLVLSVPLFVYHATSTYADTFYAIPFALSFLFFTLYVQDEKPADLRSVWLLIALTSFSKWEGEIIALASAGVPGAFLMYNVLRRRRRVGEGEWWFLVPVALYVVSKSVLSGNELVHLLAARIHPGVPGAVSPSPRLVERASTGFWYSMFSSGNFGILFYVLAVSIVAYSRYLLRSPLRWPLLTLLGLFIGIYVNAVYVTPRFTIDQGTIHRSLIVLSLPSALFVAALWESNAFPQDRSPDPRAAASPHPRARGERGTSPRPSARAAQHGGPRRKRRRDTSLGAPHEPAP